MPSGKLQSLSSKHLLTLGVMVADLKKWSSSVSFKLTSWCLTTWLAASCATSDLLIGTIKKTCGRFPSSAGCSIRKIEKYRKIEQHRLKKSKPHSRWSSKEANSQFQRTCRWLSSTSLPSEPSYFWLWSIDTKAVLGRRPQRLPKRRPGSSYYLAMSQNLGTLVGTLKQPGIDDLCVFPPVIS